MRTLSLCSGYGGLEMGLEMAGVEVDLVAYAELDKYAAKVMERHHPGIQNLGDIKQHANFTKAALGDIDILTAGYPCQPFSNAGKGLGSADPRHLWPDVAQIIRQLRPRIVLLENVRGHVTKGLKEVIADLASLGYVGSWRCVRASDIGACHRRERVFIVARDAQCSPSDPYPEESGSRGAVGESGSAPTDTLSEPVRVRSGGVGSQASQPQSTTQERQWLRADDSNGHPDAPPDTEELGRERGGGSTGMAGWTCGAR